MKDTLENFIPDLLSVPTLQQPEEPSNSGASPSPNPGLLVPETLSRTALVQDPWLAEGVPMAPANTREPAEKGSYERREVTDSGSASTVTAVHGPALADDAYEQIYDNWEGVVSYNRPEEAETDELLDYGAASLLDVLQDGQGSGEGSAAVSGEDTAVVKEGPSFNLGTMSAEAVREAIGTSLPMRFNK